MLSNFSLVVAFMFTRSADILSKSATFFLILILTVSCSSLPSTGEVIENKLTQERYEVKCSGKLLECLRIAKIDSTHRNTDYGEIEDLQNYSHRTHIHVSKEDSLQNPNVVTYYKEETDKNQLPNGEYLITETRNWEYIDSEEFEKEWNIVN